MRRLSLFILVSLIAAPALVGAEDAAPGKSRRGRKSADRADTRADPGAEAATPAGIPELRGFFGAGDDVEVSLRFPGTEHSQWYRVGVRSGGLTVESADTTNGIVTILLNGSRRTLRLAGEVVTTTPVAASPAKPGDLSAEEFRAKAARAEEIRKLRAGMTPDQRRRADFAMEDMRKAVATNGDPLREKAKTDPAAARELFTQTSTMEAAAMRAGFDIPGADGKQVVLPADFTSRYLEMRQMESSSIIVISSSSGTASTGVTTVNTGTLTIAGQTGTAQAAPAPTPSESK